MGIKNRKIASLIGMILVSNLLFSSCRKVNSNDVIINKPESNLVKETMSSNSDQIKDSENEFSLGEVSNNIYTNKYLGLSFKVLDDWHIDDGIVKDLLQGKDIKNITSTESEMIVTMYRQKIGSTKGFNPSFMMSMYNSESKSSKDWLNFIKEQMLKSTQDSNYVLEEDIHEETFSGQTYDSFSIKIKMNKGYVYQRHYCKKIKDYVIIFNYTYSTKGQLEDFEVIKKGLIIN